MQVLFPINNSPPSITILDDLQSVELKPINEQGGEARPIIVGDGSWIGINSTILDGTVIGKNCVVGAHSLVKGSFPDYCVIAGAPAKIIKRYNEQNKLWIREIKGDSSNG